MNRRRMLYIDEAQIPITRNPENPTQFEFVISKVPFPLYSGGVGAGKTTAFVWRTLFLLSNSPYFGDMSGNVGLLGRKALKDFYKTTYPELKKWMPGSWIRKEWKDAGIMELNNESVLHFTHFDDMEHLQSYNIGFAGMDQLEQIPEEVFKGVAYERLRLKFFNRFNYHGSIDQKSPIHPPVEIPIHTLFSTCNPKRGWVYDKYVKNDMKRFSPEPDIQDSYEPMFKMFSVPTVANKRYLPEQYTRNQKANMSEREYARRSEGKWDSFEGQIYPEFSDSFVNKTRYIPRPEWDIYIGIDHGGTGIAPSNNSSNITAVVFFALESRKGEWPKVHVFDELYLPSSTIEETVTEIDAKLKAIVTAQYLYYPQEMPQDIIRYPKVKAWRCDPSMNRRHGDTTETIMEAYMRHASHRGFKMPLAAGDNELESGLHKVAWLFRKKLVDINPHCVYFVAEHHSYEYGDNEKPALKQADHLCLHGKTKISTTNGDIPIEELVGKNGYVYCYDTNKGCVSVNKYNNVRKTGLQKKVLRIILDDGKEIITTPEHPFMKRDESWCIASELKNGDSMMPFYRNIDAHGHLTVHLNNGKRVFAHQLVYDDVIGIRPSDTWTWNIHHIDSDKLNNNPDNLQLVTRAEHASIHRNGSKLSDKAKNKMREAIERRIYSEEDSARRKIQLEKVRDKVNAWHKSEEGKIWHKEHGVKAAVNRNKKTFTCKQCGKEFKAYYKTRKYCSNNCKAKANRIIRCKKYGMSDITRYSHNHKVVIVEQYGYADVYNMEVENVNNFVAEGVIVHNCDAFRYICSAIPLWYKNFRIEKPETIEQQYIKYVQQQNEQSYHDDLYRANV